MVSRARSMFKRKKKWIFGHINVLIVDICDVQRLVELELVSATTLDFKNWQCSMQREVFF